MKIFVTGSTGFLGRHCIARLLRDGHEVVALTRRQQDSADTKLKYVVGTMQQLDALECGDFDACIHFAWQGVNRNGVSDTEVQRENYDCSLNVYRFAAARNCKLFIDAGSRQEYASINDIITEDTPCRPVSEYGRWKLKTHEELKHMAVADGIQYIHFRIFSVYGVDDHPWSLINSTIEKCLANEDVLLGECLHQWSFLHIDDFARAFSLAIAKHGELDAYEEFNLAGEDIRVLRCFIDDIRLLANSHSQLKYGTFKQNPESVFSLRPSLQRIHQRLGWKEDITFSEGIKQIITIKKLQEETNNHNIVL